MSATQIFSYTVIGMTCGHCVSSVTEELSAVAGIEDVKVDLDSGRIDVIGAAGGDVDAVRAAVEEAGYALAAPS